jgi:hypothetical protein
VPVVATLGACSAVASMAVPAEVVAMLISGNFSTDKEILSKDCVAKVSSNDCDRPGLSFSKKNIFHGSVF